MSSATTDGTSIAIPLLAKLYFEAAQVNSLAKKQTHDRHDWHILHLAFRFRESESRESGLSGLG
ncbi:MULTISPECIES: hypothetical protein [Sphingobium]|uniref:Uncharacterized protein n=1 Tax=Sphingobium limneticum TaxID=1007511 RepID=A0A5J5HS94_9SPHN|nr:MULTISPECIES: hypothetical protein [Sphingobium]KAA9010868.1 hypothetical protein F4U94_22170 [Sphingobium limneticum]KAA9011487.1 hypothetical protein F4U96_22955 [Sphingobium limneticum]KAA9023736.1 hypothetical protein F4U95_23010 [Sphingobium limneticum]